MKNATEMPQKELPTELDMFKHENASVDLLLKEMHHEGVVKTPNNDESSSAGSPIKPLNCQTKSKAEVIHKFKIPLGSINFEQTNRDQRKDFNSSSDTYVSDHNDEILVSDANLPAVSPSKSILRSSASSSPKKSVAFQPALDTLHTYTPSEHDSGTPTESDSPFNHLWREVDQSITSQDLSATPPPPPPHTSSTITGLLDLSRDSSSKKKASDELEHSHIDQFKMSEKGRSNMSINDKLDVFLNSSTQSNHDDLDDHLDQLGKASQEETDMNIHRLSYHLEEYKTTPESPFNALSKSLELYINSAHSSQSSLQSLIDSNRQLPADTVEQTSRGIQFNDGIKGFPDTVANLLIPMTAADGNSFSDSSSAGSHFSFQGIDTKLKKSEHDRSYDQSYNLTEKSILSLLNSASHAELSDKQQTKGAAAVESPASWKKEDSFEFQLNNQLEKLTPEQSPVVKAESPEPTVKVEPEIIPKLSQSIRHEPNDPQIKREDSDGELRVKLESDHNGDLPREQEKVPKIKHEFDNTTEHLLNEIKLEETHQHIGPRAGVMASNELGNEFLETEVDRKRLPKLDDRNESDREDSDSDSFLHDEHDDSADIHTFGVVGKAVVPGTVKLVHSADHSLNLLNSLQHSRVDTTHLEPVLNNQLPTDEHEGDSSKDQSRDVVTTKLHTEHHQRQSANDSSSTDAVDLDYYKDSLDYPQNLAPPLHVDEDSSKNSKTPDISNMLKTKQDHSTTQDFDSSVLANSSNINPPLDIKLPVVETGDNGFADLTEKLNVNSPSFEDSLSAENDAEKKPFNFLSIWHSQLTSRQPEKPAKTFYKVPSILTYNTADLSQYGKYHIPPSLQPKKFTDVNLVSTRVVNLTFEDLNVSAFLPELSQDSGLEGHFRSLVRNSSTIDADKSSTKRNSQSSRRKSFDSLNVLSELSRSGTSDTLARQPSSRRRRSTHDTLKPVMPAAPTSVNPATSMTKKSKFQVPNFEIKRSSSILSPKNQYDDIFVDGSFVEPTIKALGMKTLPSMDRDDVRRIMQMKQAMSLEEYSGLKNVGARTVSATKQEPKDKYENLQQRASIYCDSLLSNYAGVATNFHGDQDGSKGGFSSPRLLEEKSNQKTKPSLLDSHVYDLLSEKPVAIREPVEAGRATRSYGVEASPRDSVESEFPEPDLNIVTVQKTPQEHKIEGKDQPIQARKKSVNNPCQGLVELDQLNNYPSNGAIDEKIHAPTPKAPQNKLSVNSLNELTPEKVLVATPEYKKKKSARNSPIKINSPVKVVKQNGSVTGIVLDKKPSQSMDVKELQNKKLRNDKTQLSPVSVPSNIMSEWSSNIRLQNEEQSEILDGTTSKPKESPQNEKVQEKGKLFFRVVGLKNVAESEIKNRDVTFNLTLDNGIHCIQTPNYKLDAKKVDINKEFELAVSDSLEFILTLKATYTRAKPGYKEVKERKLVKSKHKIGRLFGSKDVVTTTKFIPHEVEDPLERVFATDGSFARCYVDLDLYNNQITGQACNYNLACFNEWATYTHNGQKVVKKPYHIGQLEVKMLFVPRSEDYEILPTSIKSAYESLDDLKSERSLSLEGYLHQDGGDCEAWKRRWFKLLGTSLIAHSEYSHKTRAKINLARVVEVIYVDKENLGQSSSNYRNFSDIMLMENSFKIRFANGEIIDFGAPSKTEKMLWIKTIQEIVYRNKFRRQPWVKLMQAKNGDKRKLWIEA